MGYQITNSTRFLPQSLDAAGALVTAQKSVLGNYVQNVDELPLLLDRVSTGTATQSWTNGIVTMSTSGTDYTICQTYKRHLYLAGKSQQIDMTFSRMGIQANVIKRVGYFSSDTSAPYTANKDGFYLEMDGTTYNIVIAKGGSLTTIPRASWDDPLDGTGVSGLNLDLNLFIEMTFKFLYLGGTSLEVSFNVGGDIYIAHTYKNSGLTANTFINSPVQPVRWEMISNGAAGTFDQICAAVSTGGVLDLVGYPRAVDSTTKIDANVIGTSYMLAALRLSDVGAILSNLTGDTLAATNDDYFLRFVLNPTIAGTVTWITPSTPGSQLANSNIDYVIGSTSNTTTGGTMLRSLPAEGNSTRGIIADSLFQVGTAIDGTFDIVALCGIPLSANLDLFPSINFSTL